MGTTIWGSSSLGVNHKAAAPAIRETRMRSTDRLPRRNTSTIRETMLCSCGVVMVASFPFGRIRPAQGGRLFLLLSIQKGFPFYHQSDGRFAQSGVRHFHSVQLSQSTLAGQRTELRMRAPPLAWHGQ